jgi:DNA repair photolyase
MAKVRLIPKKSSTFHDFPYTSPQRKCFHCWIVNVTPPGPSHCVHNCVYCYAREAIYSDYSREMIIYSNLPELVEKDLRTLRICPPVSISNVTDPCQNIPELQYEVKRLVKVLMDYGVSFAITTKGDPSFLLEIPGFAEYEPKLIATTIEGPPEVLQLLSPDAPPFYARLVTVHKLSSMGIRVIVRLDPVFIHLYEALYGKRWFNRVADLIDTFAAVGTRHIVASTGRLSRKQVFTSNSKERSSSWQRVFDIIRSYSPVIAMRFERDYKFERDWAGQGYRLRKGLRLEFHHKLRRLAESKGMTYATCQELSAKESDSKRIPHCEGLPLPFTRRGLGSMFYPIPGCSANCHTSCSTGTFPSCGQPGLITAEPLKRSLLR